MKNPDQENLNRLIKGYIKGDAREFFIITGWIEKVVNNYNWGLKDYSEDIIQDVRLKVYLNLKESKFRRASMLKTYVYRIAKYTCIDFLRKSYSQQVTNDTSLIENMAESNPFDGMIKKEKEQIAHTILEELAAMCRETLHLVFVEKLTYNEISAILNIAEGTVKSRVFRCIGKALQLKEKYWNDLKTDTTVRI
ncbi:MAG: RNA polymerase sigma factor [Bacteroidales bacterium]|nr:RNA polymerase sigma factor [Bacteroidales bacterium]